MPLIEYPSSLPSVQSWREQPAERRASSGLRQPGDTFRARAREYRATAGASWTYTSAQMHVWRNWFDDDLGDGLRWFALRCPGHGGPDVARQVRFLSVSEVYLGLGLWRVTAELDLQRPVILQPFVTSKPYPQEVTAALEVALTLTAGTLRTAWTTTTEAIETAVRVGDGSLRDLLQARTVEPDAVESSLAVGDGTLRDLLHGFTLEPEGVQAALTVGNGTLREALITYSNFPTEALETACSVTGGTLTP